MTDTAAALMIQMSADISALRKGLQDAVGIHQSSVNKMIKQQKDFENSIIVGMPAMTIPQIPAANGRSSSAIFQHFSLDLRGAVMTQDLIDQMNKKSEAAAQRGAVMGAKLALNPNNLGPAYSQMAKQKL